MEKHCDSEKRFGKEDGRTAARNEILESFIRDAGPQARAMAYRYAGNEAEAQELLQDALCRAMRGWKGLKRGRSLAPWFFVILRNCFLSSRRRAEHRLAVSLDRESELGDGEPLSDVLADGCEAVETRLERQETAEAVRRALSRLRAKDRAVLSLRDLHGMHYGEIARVLGVRVETVRTRIFRARQALRSQSPELAGLGN